MDHPDLRALMMPLTPAVVGIDGYGRTQRYADFRAVFFGDTRASAAQKERVLFQLLAECGIHHHIDDVQNVNQTYKRLGKREVGLTLMAWLTEEPPTEMPTETERDPRNWHG